MNDHARPHVHIRSGLVYIERVPNAWVLVCSLDDYRASSEDDRRFLVSQALATGWDTVLPADGI